MEPTSDKRFDPHFGVQLLLDIAQERSVEPLLKKIVEAQWSATQFVFSQVWLIEKGDLCATCKYRSECPDQSRCLHLVAGERRNRFRVPERSRSRFDDLNARDPAGFRPAGRGGRQRSVETVTGVRTSSRYPPPGLSGCEKGHP